MVTVYLSEYWCAGAAAGSLTNSLRLLELASLRDRRPGTSIGRIVGCRRHEGELAARELGLCTAAPAAAVRSPSPLPLPPLYAAPLLPH